MSIMYVYKCACMKLAWFTLTFATRSIFFIIIIFKKYISKRPSFSLMEINQCCRYNTTFRQNNLIFRYASICTRWYRIIFLVRDLNYPLLYRRSDRCIKTTYTLGKKARQRPNGLSWSQIQNCTMRFWVTCIWKTVPIALHEVETWTLKKIENVFEMWCWRADAERWKDERTSPSWKRWQFQRDSDKM